MSINYDRDTTRKVVSEGKEYYRQPCEVITRVMGYFRPVSHYNTWKKSEFYSRKYFDQFISANTKFIDDYKLWSDKD